VITGISDQTAFANAVAARTYIRFGEGITEIASSANGVFQNNAALNNASNLKFIEFNPNFTSIGNYAFYGCKGITSVRLQKTTALNSPVTIGLGAFEKCVNLTNINFIGDAIPNLMIDERAFYSCEKLSDFVGALPDSIDIADIGDYAFAYCNALSYNMLDKIRTVGGTQKIKDGSVSKQYIYFRPEAQAAMYTKGCLAYGEIAS
jgi:hypothetical protein